MIEESTEEFTSVRRGTRLLCVTCGSLKSTLRDNTDKDPKTLRLECGHTRTAALPAKQGHVSLENLSTAEGMKCFPPNMREGYQQAIYDEGPGAR